MKNLELLKLALELQFKLDFESGEVILEDKGDHLYIECYGDCFNIEENPYSVNLFDVTYLSGGCDIYHHLTIAEVFKKLNCFE